MQKFVQKSTYFYFYITIITNMEQYSTNSNIHGRNTKYGSDFHQTISHVSISKRFWSYGTQGFQ